MSNVLCPIATPLSLPFAIGQISSHWLYAAQVRAAQAAVCAGDPLAALVLTDDVTRGGVNGNDSAHYNANGMALLGGYFAAAMASLPDPDTVSPLARFSASPTNGLAPLTVTFADFSIGNITNRQWSFGDGVMINSAGTTLSHTYTVPGTYVVNLIVSGPLGSATDTVVIKVNTPPVVTAGPNQAVTLSGDMVPWPWTPAYIATAAWHDANDAITVTSSGGAVSQWNDKSGNGNHAIQGTASAQPKTGTQTINGLNVLAFDGGDKLVSTFTLSGDRSAYVVFKYNTTGDVFVMDNRATASATTFYSLSSVYKNYNGGTTEIGTEAMDTSPHMRDFIISGTSGTNYHDGASDASGTVAANSMNGLSIGARYTGGVQLDGYIGEIILCAAAHDTATRQKVEGYLAHRWGLTNSLPAGHPYKSAAPTSPGLGVIATLAGTASDPDGDPLTTIWSLVSTQPSGLAAPTFGNASVTNTTATFTQLGQYTLRLTASDGTLAATNEVVITVTDGSQSHVITVTAGANGAISPSGAVTVADGANQAFTITPASHYAIASVRTNGTNVTIANPAGFTYTWNNVRAAGTLDASFIRAKTVNKSIPTEWLATAVPASTNDYEAAVLDDPDGDGFSTWQEYWSGTDPMDSNSYFKLDSIHVSGTNLVLQWRHAQVDAAIPPICIQGNTNLISGVWENAGQHAPVNGVNAWTNTAAAQPFYRICVTNAP